MDIYNRYVLPRLIDLACGMSDVVKQRSLLVPRVHGRVLGIGPDTGFNLGLYDVVKVSAIVGVDPATQMQALARKHAAQIDIPMEVVALELNEIRAEAESFDTIVCTSTLCSIAVPLPALGEMCRILKHDGELLFCEYGRTSGASVLAWQQRLTPWWRPLAGGYHLDRDMPALLREAGSRIDELEQGCLPEPQPMTYVYRGIAR